MDGRIVIVGAGVAGLRTAEALRASGHTGELVVAGDEPYLPYQRPPLSKTALSAGGDLDGLLIRRRRSVADVDWRVGRTAVAVSPEGRTLTLAGQDGDEDLLTWDGLVIASGLRPRRLQLPGPVAGRYAVRTLDDARALRERLRPGARVVVLGAGFLGCEVAATAVGLGCDVVVVAPEAQPMETVLGPLVGAALRSRHEAEGVRFRLGRRPASLEGPGAGGAVSAVVLDDGTTLPAEVVVEAVGSVPATGWLAGSGIDITDGVLCDPWLRAIGTDGTVLPHVVAVGDVARYPNPLLGGAPRRVEHWDLAPLTARRAAPALLAGLTGAALDPATFAPLPSFWSDQYDLTIQVFGTPDLADDVTIVHGAPGEPFVAEYRRDGRLVAGAGVGTMTGLMELRAALAEAATAA